MHESSLLADLIKKILELAQQAGALKVVKVTLQIGALANISAEHLREHFVEAVAGTIIEGAQLVAIESSDVYAPTAQDILLKDIDVE
jgi:hydrogenase nickel incorporation protein HypA/HybF